MKNYNIRLTSSKDHKHRGVAPIIATLLMVAIAVIGGMMVFVFAQGFFEDTQIQSPQVEQLMIWGYNATDNHSAATLATHAGSEETITDAVKNRLGDNEEFYLYVRNISGGEVFITKVLVYGVEYPYVGGSSFDLTGPAWTMSVNGQDIASDQTLGPGQEATIVIGYDTATNGEVKNGRPMVVALETGGGNLFTKQIKVGMDSIR